MSGVDCPKCIVVTFGAGRMVFGLLRKLLAMGGSEAIGLKQRYHYVYRMPISVCLWGIQALTLLSRSGEVTLSGSCWACCNAPQTS